jgi:hypothetical protein
VNKAKKWKSRGSTPRHKARERDALFSLSLSLSLWVGAPSAKPLVRQCASSGSARELRRHRPQSWTDLVCRLHGKPSGVHS